MAASLLAVVLLSKAVVLWGRPIAWDAAATAAYVWQDALVVLAFLAVQAVAGHWRHGRAVVVTLYGCGVIYTAINAAVIRVLSTPLTLPMIRAARGALADSVLLQLTSSNLAVVVVIAAVGAALPWFCSRRTGEVRSARPVWRQTLGAAVLVVAAVAGGVAVTRIDTAGLHRNAVVALVESAFPRVSARARVADWTAPLFESSPADDLSALRGIAAGRNVVMVGLESTAAQYLRAYGGENDLTPRLDDLIRHSVVFDHAYAVTPESIKGLFSVLCSRYAAFDAPADAYRTTECQPIAGELGKAGYRTALFHSGRFGYLNMSAVVQHRGFDVLEDAAEIGGRRESSFGVDEPATVDRMLAWIDTLDDDDRFLLTYLPIAAHHPYATTSPGPFPEDDDWGRYRNAVREGDSSLGVLIDGLRSRGLYESTLWIVYGDHGEAFGQHEANYGHTFFLYEENVHVPFIVAVPGAIEATRRSRTSVSLVDTAPTILDLLGLPVPRGYQGRTALDGESRMVLFFADYSLSLVGLRDGRWKFVHDLASGRSKLFDLEGDVGEGNDRAADHPVRTAAYARVLRDWSAAQKARMQ